MNPYELRKFIGKEEFDYQALRAAIQDYRAPDQKINTLLKERAIIRVKKGLYTFGPEYSLKPYSRELLANLIYGPSYISLEYALAFYSLIPERVETVTSVTCKKNKRFETPVGVFTYNYLKMDLFRLGVVQVEIGPDTRVLMASPEKALIDYLTIVLKKQKFTRKDIPRLLFEDLRLDETELLKTIRIPHFQSLASKYKSKVLFFIQDYLLELAGEAK